MKSAHKLWYTRPADAWTEALPIGNGRLGAMVFAGGDKSRFALNEDTLWGGYPRAYSLPRAQAALESARALMQSGEYQRAQEVLEADFAGPDCQAYLPLGDLFIDFGPGALQDYRRELDIENGLARAEYTRGGTRITQECFASHADQGIFIEITASAPISFEISLVSPLKSSASAHRGVIMLDGRCPSGHIPPDVSPDDDSLYPDNPALSGMSFRAVATAEADGRILEHGCGLRVEGATRAVVRLVARTSFAGPDKHPRLEGRDEAADCANDLAKISSVPYAALKERHIADFAGFMNRVELSLGGSRTDMPTDERLLAFEKAGEDPALIELIFQYGRYLLLSGSRPGTQAMNLQGIWNESVRPPWHCDYTVNINTEMNYWPAEPLNLSETHLPLFGLLQALRKTGERTAKELYGAGGMVAHHNIDIWAHATPVSGGRRDIAQWSFWPMSAAWMSRHLFDHYLYTMDLDFLGEVALPVLRECAQFFADTLFVDENGHAHVFPATSPENRFLINGRPQAVAKSATMSNAIVRELFENYLAATELTHAEEPLRATVAGLLGKIKPFELGEKGQLLEWDAEYEEAEPHHRHVSHLYALHPSHQITPDGTPALARAARRTLELRGDDGTGWSLGWKINFWARLFDGDHALSLLKMQLRPAADGGKMRMSGGGTYPNLFDAHPPFQIDGNFAASAGVAELLMQSRPDALLLIPALPASWAEFSVSGLKAMRCMEVSMSLAGGVFHAEICAERRPAEPVCVMVAGEKKLVISEAGHYTITL